MTDTSLTVIQFLQDHQIGCNDFAGASQFQGGYVAMDVCGLPTPIAVDLVARQIARPAPAAASRIAPTTIMLRFQQDRTITFDESPRFYGSYLSGDVNGFPETLADALIAEGVASLA